MNSDFDFQPSFDRIDGDASDASVVVYWMHHAGGSLSVLARAARDHAASLPLEIRSAAMPAREELSGVVFDTDLDSMAKQLAIAIASERDTCGDERPFLLIGHSFGSVMAYRTAAHLIELGHRPHRLVVLSFPAADKMTHAESLHQLSDQQLVEMVDQLFGGVPPEILSDADSHAMFAPAMRFDLGMLERYAHDASGQALPIPLTAVCGADDKAVDLAQMQRWTQMTSSDFRLRSVPGDHFFPLEQLGTVLRIAAWEWLDEPGENDPGH